MKKLDSKTLSDLINQNTSVKKNFLFNSFFDLPIGFEGKIIPNKTLGDLQVDVFVKENGQTFITLSFKGQGNFYKLNLTDILNEIHSTSIECKNIYNRAIIKNLEERILTPTGKIKKNVDDNEVKRYEDLISLPELSVDEVMADVGNRIRFALDFINTDNELFELLKGFNFSLYVEKNGVFEKQQLEKKPNQTETFFDFVKENTVFLQGRYNCYYDRTIDDTYEEEEISFNFSQKIFVLEELTEAIYYRLINSVNDFLKHL
jgi:hypothetical protein